MEIDEVRAVAGKPVDVRADEQLRLVGGVVEDLNLEPIARVIHLRDSFQEPCGHGGFVEERKLDGDER
jgi:hypothetical protein